MKIIVFSLLIIMAEIVSAQDYKVFNKTDGIPLGVVSCIQDSAGNIWFGGRDGISKWDGKQFTFIEHKYRTLVEGGLKLHNYKNNIIVEDNSHWSLYKVKDDKQLIEIGTNIYFVVSSNEDHIFGRDDKNIYDLQGDRFIKIQEVGEVSAMLNDLNNDLWVASSKGLFKYKNGQLPLFENSPNLPKKVFGMFGDSKSNIWITTSDGIYKYDNNTWFVFYKNQGITSNLAFTEFFEDSHGNVWFTTTEDGLYKFDINNNVTNYKEKDGLYSDHISDIIEDKDGNILVAHYAAGISVFKNNKWENSKQGSGYYLNNPFTIGGWAGFPTSIFEDYSNNIWLTCVGGDIAMFNGEKWEVMKHVDAHNWHIYSIRNNSKVWFSSGGGGLFPGIGLCCYDLKTQKFTQLMKENISKFFVDRAGNIWACSENSIYLIPKDKE
jgi:ligand-binding sensor domain-containing protein